MPITRPNDHLLLMIERLLRWRIWQVSVKTNALAVFLAVDRVDGLDDSEHYIGYIPINMYTEAVLPGVEAHTVMGGLIVQASD